MSSVVPIPSNAYTSWLEVAKSAQSQLVIFSPFLDEMVLHLFEECPLESNRLSLVTQIDWHDATMSSLNKSVVIHQLVKSGVDVRYLSRLHAKAIVADWDRAVIGSQNFTYFSQQSYEVSFQLDRFAGSVDLDDVFETLNEWWDLAAVNMEVDDE